MHGGTFGWIELVFFYGIAIGFGVWQWLKMDRMLKQTRAAKAASAAAESDAAASDAAEREGPSEGPAA